MRDAIFLGKIEMNRAYIELEARTEVLDAMYRHAASLKSLSMETMLAMPKYEGIRVGLEQICAALMNLQSEMSCIPLDEIAQ